MTQTVIVYIIGALLAVYVGYRVYRIFSRKEYNKLCGGCPLAEECGKRKVDRRTCPDSKNGGGNSCCH